MVKLPDKIQETYCFGDVFLAFRLILLALVSFFGARQELNSLKETVFGSLGLLDHDHVHVKMSSVVMHVTEQRNIRT